MTCAAIARLLVAVIALTLAGAGPTLAPGTGPVTVLRDPPRSIEVEIWDYRR